MGYQNEEYEFMDTLPTPVYSRKNNKSIDEIEKNLTQPEKEIRRKVDAKKKDIAGHVPVAQGGKIDLMIFTPINNEINVNIPPHLNTIANSNSDHLGVHGKLTVTMRSQADAKIYSSW